MAFKFNKRINKDFLTLVLLIIITVFVSTISADLAPKEEDDDDIQQEPQDDLKKDVSLTTLKPPETGSKLGFIHGFIASFSVIIVSEIGDKTFFIAAIMSMKYPRLTVFSGAISALALMTVLSAVFGFVFVQFIPANYTRWISVFLFVAFGLKMLHEGWKMTATDAAEEMEEVQHEVRKREEEMRMKSLERKNNAGDVTVDVEPNTLTKLTSSDVEVRMANKESVKSTDAETGGAKKLKASPFSVILRIFVQAFTMTFVAEWGDRSQITTIVLSASENLWGVIAGGIIGHAICTGLGVIGGRMIAQKISVRTVTLIGGVVFLLFAITSTIWDPTDINAKPAGGAAIPSSGGN